MVSVRSRSRSRTSPGTGMGGTLPWPPGRPAPGGNARGRFPEQRRPMSVSSSPDAWLDHVAGELPEHARVLRALLTAVRGDARIRTLELEGSLGRDDGDECSDLDAGMGIADDAWPAILDDVAGLVAPAGEVVD